MPEVYEEVDAVMLPQEPHAEGDSVTAGAGGEAPVYYYCLDHGLVEGAVGCRAEVRLGPYPTFDEASRALETARRRTELWDAVEDEWDNGSD
jgi:hypothetical protein